MRRGGPPARFPKAGGIGATPGKGGQATIEGLGRQLP
jgi:hypothetical protein